MRYRMLIGAGGALAAIIVVSGFVHEHSATAAVEPSADEKAIQTAIDDYCTAFNKGDGAGVLAIWAHDAEYIDDTGKSTKGHVALAALFKAALAASKGAKEQIKTSSMRFFNDVAWQDGVSVLTQANGESESQPFTAIWTKKDGKWLLSLVREQPGEAADDKDAPNPHLKELSWLIGDWVHDDKDMKITFTAKWMKGEKFLLIDMVVFRKGEESMSMIQVIGWDAKQEQVRSWLFDTRGGFGEGSWTRKGNAWTVDAAGITADGRVGAGIHIWKSIDGNTFSWEGTERVVGGQALPDHTTTYQRVKKTN
jgi:uncharacterized protein (TIGR02246 family)